MDLLRNHLLTVLILLPLVGTLVTLLIPRDERGQLRTVGMVTLLADLALSLLLFAWYDADKGGIQLEERVAWLPTLGISYHVGVDGIAGLLIVLTTFLAPIVLASTFGSIQTRVKELVVSLLVLQTAMVGTFAALDLVLFFVFWELMLVPMYLLIGIWGSERRIYAALKFFLFTAVGSMLMFAGILYLYWQTKNLPGAAGPSFEYADMLRLAVGDNPVLGKTAQAWLFGAFALAFCIKVPLFPLHTWLPDAHVQAPAAGSVVLAGVLLKMGTFGLVRYAMPLFPDAAQVYAPLLGWLAVAGIVYGSLMCMAQTDMKKLIAYSSVAHLGFVVLGLSARTPEATGGAVLQMVNHGISTGALFLLVGYLYDRRHTRDIAAYGGQARVTPVFAAIFVVVTLSSIGLPGTNGFVGEFLILTGTFSSLAVPTPRLWSVLAATGVVLGAVYMLTLVQKVWFGPVRNPDVEATKDLRGRELGTLLPLVAVIVLMGVYPQPFLNYVKRSVGDYVARTAPAVLARPAIPERLLQFRKSGLPGMLPRRPGEPLKPIERPFDRLPAPAPAPAPPPPSNP